MITVYQKSIMNHVSEHVPDGKWKDYRWQLEQSIKDIATFEKLTGIVFTEEERAEFEKTVSKFPLSITPYYASLIEIESYHNDPIFKQAFPTSAELKISRCDMADPLHEDKDSPVEGITHRYPDRVLFLVSNSCSMYCRHCTRKRKVGDPEHIPSKVQILNGIRYIRNNRQVRDVLLSGGDPFMLPDDYLDWILTELRQIPHVEIIRIGSRMPVVLPYRITDELVEMLKKHHPVWLNTHFNHPRELTRSAREALQKLADAGIPLGNQSVLLAGVNDYPRIMKKLNQKLMLLHQIKGANAKYFEGTVNPSNKISQSNFCEIAESLSAKCEKEVLFTEEDFENDGHEAEILYRIGPISQN